MPRPGFTPPGAHVEVHICPHLPEAEPQLSLGILPLPARYLSYLVPFKRDTPRSTLRTPWWETSTVLGPLRGDAPAWSSEGVATALGRPRDIPHSLPHQVCCTFGPHSAPPPPQSRKQRKLRPFIFLFVSPPPASSTACPKPAMTPVASTVLPLWLRQGGGGKASTAKLTWSPPLFPITREWRDAAASGAPTPLLPWSRGCTSIHQTLQPTVGASRSLPQDSVEL